MKSPRTLVATNYLVCVGRRQKEINFLLLSWGLPFIEREGSTYLVFYEAKKIVFTRSFSVKVTLTVVPWLTWAA